MSTLQNRLDALERQRSELVLTARERWEVGRTLDIRLQAKLYGEAQTLAYHKLSTLPPEPPKELLRAFERSITPTDIEEAEARLAKLWSRYAPA